MKTCMTLILATTTLYLSAAKEDATKNCDNPEPMTAFGVDKTLGILPITSLGLILIQIMIITVLNFYKKKQNDNIKEVFSIYNTTTKAYSYYLSFSKTTSFVEKNGKYTAKHIQVNKEGKELEEHLITATYLDTDYDSYSVVYVCGEMMDNLFSLYAVQSRNKTLDSNVETKVNSVLNKVQLNLDGLFSTKEVNCEFDDSTLNKLLSKPFTYENE